MFTEVAIKVIAKIAEIAAEVTIEVIAEAASGLRYCL